MAWSARALDVDGGVAFGERELRAHGFKGLANALHGTAGKGCVANQREAALLRREQAGDHAHGGAGVAAVEGVVGGRDAASRRR